MDSRLQECINEISSEKKGDDVRRSVRKALIVLDDIIIHMSKTSALSEYKSSIDTMLNLFWNDVILYFPDAVRPTYEEETEDEKPMNEELKAALMGFISSINGIDIRSSMYMAWLNIGNRLVDHDIVANYYARRTIDIFNALIDASDDNEKKATAREDMNTSGTGAIHANTFMASYHTDIHNTISLLREVKTGSVAREELLSLLNIITLFIDTINEYIENSQLYPDQMTEDNAILFDLLIRDLVGSGAGKYRLSVGGPYSSGSELNTRLAYCVENYGTLLNFKISGQYVIINWPFYTYSSALSNATSYNRMFTDLNASPIESDGHTYLMLFGNENGYTSGSDAMTLALSVYNNYGITTFISQEMVSTAPYMVLSLHSQYLTPQTAADSMRDFIADHPAYTDGGSIMRADYIGDITNEYYFLLAGVYTGSDAGDRATARRAEIMSRYHHGSLSVSRNGQIFTFVLQLDNNLGFTNPMDAFTYMLDFSMQNEIVVFYTMDGDI